MNILSRTVFAAAVLSAGLSSTHASFAASLPNKAIFTTDRTGGSLQVINADTLTVETTIDVGQEPLRVKADLGYRHVWVVNFGSDSVSVIGRESGVVEATIPVGGGPNAVAFSGPNAYIANSRDDSITVIDTTTFAVRETVPVLGTPSTLAVHPTRPELWIASGATGRVLESRSLGDLNVVLGQVDSTSRLFGSQDLDFSATGDVLWGSEGCGFCGRFAKLDASDSQPELIQGDILSDGSGSAIGISINPSTGVPVAVKYGQNPAIRGPYLKELGGLGRDIDLVGHPNDFVHSLNGEAILITRVDPSPSLLILDAETLQEVGQVSLSGLPQGVGVAAIVPEPSSLAICSTGLLAVLFATIRKRLT
jgi:YVTN family beta-propeller protein